MTGLAENYRVSCAICLLWVLVSRSKRDLQMLRLLSHCYVLTGDQEKTAMDLRNAKDLNPDNILCGF